MASSVSVTSSSGNEDSRKEVHGRMFNVLCETYALPADDDEWGRLNKQHIAFVISVGGLYPDAEVVRSVLAPEDGEQKKILDLGYGTGVWSIAMAKEFPHIQVVGLDLIDCPTDASRIPENCTFLKEDVNLGLSSHHGQYSFVHARLIGSGQKDFKTSMLAMQKCLKPGGFLLLTDADFDFYGPDTDNFWPVASEENPKGSYFCRIIAEFARAVGKFGGDLKGTAQALDEGLWDVPLIDPATCKTASAYWPLGPWKDDEDPSISETLQYVGGLVREDVKKLARGGSAVLMKAGWPEATVKEWMQHSDEELDSMNPHLWGRTRFAWGRLRASPNEPAPALPPAPEKASTKSQDPTAPVIKPYPEFHVYQTKEISLQAQARRNRGKNVP